MGGGCLTHTDQDPAVIDSCFLITSRDFYGTEFFGYSVLPSACLNLQPPPPGTWSDEWGRGCGGPACCGVPPPLGNVLPVTLLWGQGLSCHLGSLGYFGFWHLNPFPLRAHLGEDSASNNPNCLPLFTLSFHYTPSPVATMPLRSIQASFPSRGGFLVPRSGR